MVLQVVIETTTSPLPREYLYHISLRIAIGSHDFRTGWEHVRLAGLFGRYGVLVDGGGLA